VRRLGRGFSTRTISRMGIYDRDYYRDAPPRGGFGYFNAWSVTTWLIVANVAVFVLDGLLRRASHPAIDPDLLYDPAAVRYLRDLFTMGPLERWGYFSTDAAITHGQVWRFLSFQFLHASPTHLLFNMIGMYLFGPIAEAHFGSRRYLAFYLLCGLAGAATYLLLSAAGVLRSGPDTPLVGASAGIFGLLVAAAMIAPHVEIWIYFAIPITVRTLAFISIGMAAYAVFLAGPAASNAGGEAAHLGGGALAFLLIKNQHWLNAFAPRRRYAAGRGGAVRRPRPGGVQKDWSKDFDR
jgi:membrane associated rhomboid family serine protease